MYLNQQQFNKTYSAHFNSLLGYFKYKCNNSFEAEDLAQESFVKLWLNREKIESGKEIAFLYTIANNLFIDMKRKDNVKLKYTTNLKASMNTETPEFSVLYNEFNGYVNAKINDLPEGSKQVFILNKIDKLTYAEISKIIGLSIKSVEKKMSIALKTYRELKKAGI
jgi:RNA polymerase sigma factor (sigma-70 family)